MALYQDEAVAIFAEAVDPFTKEQIVDLTATFEVWHVETHGDPKNDPDVRVTPGWAAVAMTYEAAALGYVGFFAPDNDRLPGRYAYRVHLVGDAWDNYEIATFTLKP